ncbi:hypothetical protein HMPREF1554_02186, partial [Porphyromonas gingivalis F0569]
EDFNCTIQELKLRAPHQTLLMDLYFNCTIQELKLQIITF